MEVRPNAWGAQAIQLLLESLASPGNLPRAAIEKEECPKICHTTNIFYHFASGAHRFMCVLSKSTCLRAGE